MWFNFDQGDIFLIFSVPVLFKVQNCISDGKFSSRTGGQHKEKLNFQGFQRLFHCFLIPKIKIFQVFQGRGINFFFWGATFIPGFFPGEHYPGAICPLGSGLSLEPQGRETPKYIVLTPKFRLPLRSNFPKIPSP